MPTLEVSTCIEPATCINCQSELMCTGCQKAYRSTGRNIRTWEDVEKQRPDLKLFEKGRIKKLLPK